VATTTNIAGEPLKDPLPATVFKNLQVGKKQTVIVYGTSLSDGAEWSKAMKGYFDKQYPGLVTFVNSAKSGEHSDWAVANLQGRVLSHKPDLLIIEFSVNDAATKHKISIEKSAANLDSMVSALRQENPQADIVLQTMNSVWDPPPPQSKGKKPASDRPHLADYYDVYRKYAHEHNLPLVDNYPVWLKIQQEDEEKFKKWLPEGAHPIPGASLAVTWPAIEALLEKARLSAQ
jgi:lysophospholipase L1-like esterase